MFLLAQLQGYPQMKVKSWNWFYNERYCVYCYRSLSVIEPFETFMAIKNVMFIHIHLRFYLTIISHQELGLKRNRSNKRKRCYSDESSESSSESSSVESDSDDDTFQKFKKFFKNSEKVSNLKLKYFAFIIVNSSMIYLENEAQT
jgi:hypothetical protein